MREGTRADRHPHGELTCVIADDHPAVLDAASRYVDASGITASAAVANGDAALAAVQEHRPAVAVVDLTLPGLSGTELIAAIHRESPETAVVVYTGDQRAGTLNDALDAGATAYVLKDAPMAELVRAIKMASTGARYVDSGLAGALIAGPAVNLSERERQVLRLVGEGMSNEEIGATLFVSPETVRAHLAKASRKLGARTRTQAVVTALRLSLIS